MYQWVYWRGLLCWTRVMWRCRLGIGRLGIQQKIRLDSSRYDTSNNGAVGALIFPWLEYSGSSSKLIFWVLAACVSVCPKSSAFSDRGTAFWQSHYVCCKLFAAAASAHFTTDCVWSRWISKIQLNLAGTLTAPYQPTAQLHDTLRLSFSWWVTKLIVEYDLFSCF